MRWTRTLTVTATAVLTAALSIGLAGVAQADPGSGPGWGSIQNPYDNPGGGVTSGSDGAPTVHGVGGCSVYSTSSTYGLSCLEGGAHGYVQTVSDYLKGEPAPSCWDDKIQGPELWRRYGKHQSTTEPIDIETCLSGLDMGKSPGSQQDLQINQVTVETSPNAPACYNYDEQNKKATPFPPDTNPLSCIKTLTNRQKGLVGELEAEVKQIPGISLSRYPSDTVHTNQQVAYQDLATAPGGTPTQTETATLDTVSVWAVMTNYRVFPNGPDSDPVCTNSVYGTQRLTPTSTIDSDPNACWYAYPQSSAGQPNEDYQLRAEADWTVYYQAAGQPAQTLTEYQKYITVLQPVYDVQTLVTGVGTGTD